MGVQRNKLQAIAKSRSIHAGILINVVVILTTVIGTCRLHSVSETNSVNNRTMNITVMFHYKHT